MSNSRRTFLQSSAALAVGMMGGANAVTLAAETTTGLQAPKPHSGGPLPKSEIQVPTMKFGNAEISRLVLGVNPLYGFSHYNNNFGTAMREWYTPEKVCEVLHRANSFGINAFNWVNVKRSPEDLARFQAEGGKMHLIIQVMATDDAVSYTHLPAPHAHAESQPDSQPECRRSAMSSQTPSLWRERLTSPLTWHLSLIHI